MAKGHIIAGIDIGNATVKTVVAELRPDLARPQVVGVGMAPSNGMRAGMVIDLEEAAHDIRNSLHQATSNSDFRVNHVYASLSGVNVKTQASRGVIVVSRADNQISEIDVERVIEAASAVSLPSNREIIHVIPKGFVVDGQEFIKNPIGMTGVRLEADVFLVDAPSHFVRDIARAFERAGVEVAEFVFSPLAASKAVLDKRSKEHGALMLDLGGGLCSLAVFEEGDLIHTAVLPLGSKHITNDLAIALRTSLDTAEQVKLEFAFLDHKSVSKKDIVDLASFTTEEPELTVSRKLIGEVVDARVSEIMEMVAKELKKINRYNLLPAGVTIIGGGSKIQGFSNLVKDQLKLPVHAGTPLDIDGVLHRVDDPAFATVVGLVLWGFDKEGGRFKGHSIDNLVVNKATQKIKEWFKNFLP